MIASFGRGGKAALSSRERGALEIWPKISGE